MDQGHDKEQDKDHDNKSAANGEQESLAENAAADAGGSASSVGESAKHESTNDLPVVVSPKIGSGEDEPEHEAESDSPHETMPALIAAEPTRDAETEQQPQPQPRSFRFALLAATIALAAGAGSVLGSMGASGIAHRAPAETAIPKTADARDVVQALKAQLAELTALKASLDGTKSSTGTQLAKITERLDSLERAQAEPAAKLARLAEAVDRLEKRAAAAPETTGSIAASPPAAAPGPANTAALSVPPSVLQDWVVQDVRNGRAMVESRYGGIFLVGSGSVLPGLGKVEAVKRQDGEWVVVTDKGVITSPR